MKKQYLFAGAGILLVILIFIFGRTIEPKKAVAPLQNKAVASDFSIRQFVDSSRQKLIPSQALQLTSLETSLTSSDLQGQVLLYDSLAKIWKDSARVFEPYAFYISEAAKLDNSEKKLTFAAQLFLELLRSEHDEAKLNWETTEAIDLFERAIKLNPSNDDLRIGLGSCYVYGKGRSGNPQETMKGIQELLAVARRDSNNMKAQIVLGVGGLVSGQYDKALERFKKVLAREPNNVQAISYIAEVYVAKADKAEAIKWYTLSKRLVNDPHYSQEVDERIRMMK